MVLFQSLILDNGDLPMKIELEGTCSLPDYNPGPESRDETPDPCYAPLVFTDVKYFKVFAANEKFAEKIRRKCEAKELLEELSDGTEDLDGKEIDAETGETQVGSSRLGEGSDVSERGPGEDEQEAEEEVRSLKKRRIEVEKVLSELADIPDEPNKATALEDPRFFDEILLHWKKDGPMVVVRDGCERQDDNKKEGEDNEKKKEPEKKQIVLEKGLSLKRVFVGRSALVPASIFSGGWGRAGDGNSVLLEFDNSAEDASSDDTVASSVVASSEDTVASTVASTSGAHYCYIGQKYCLRFEAIAKIASYVSPIGNSGSPYPYATDTLGNLYLFAGALPSSRIREAKIAVIKNSCVLSEIRACKTTNLTQEERDAWTEEHWETMGGNLLRDAFAPRSHPGAMGRRSRRDLRSDPSAEDQQKVKKSVKEICEKLTPLPVEHLFDPYTDFFYEFDLDPYSQPKIPLGFLKALLGDKDGASSSVLDPHPDLFSDAVRTKSIKDIRDRKILLQQHTLPMRAMTTWRRDVIEKAQERGDHRRPWMLFCDDDIKKTAPSQPGPFPVHDGLLVTLPKDKKELDEKLSEKLSEKSDDFDGGMGDRFFGLIMSREEREAQTDLWKIISIGMEKRENAELMDQIMEQEGETMLERIKEMILSEFWEVETIVAETVLRLE